MTVAEQTKVTTATTPKTYSYALGYLRAFLVVLVVAHHAVLAYFSFAPPAPASLIPQPRWWQAFPVFDSHKWSGAAPFAGFNDLFFMSLMFFLSGVFVWQGLVRKGSANFLRDRELRLGLPFIASVVVLAPLAYYPTFLQTHAGGFTAFCRQWISLGTWPAGPAWFVWVLLAFDCLAAGLFAIAPRWGEALGRALAGVSRRPIPMFVTVIVVSAVTYIPMALVFTPIAWAAWGPFTFQTSRILHYLAYFLIGVGMGAWGVNRGFLSSDGKLARRWPLWVGAAVVSFLADSTVWVIAMTQHPQSKAWATGVDAGFVLSCAASSFAFLALFLRFAKSRTPILDSLNANSYAIYVLHYAFVSWLQYALLPSSIPGFARFAIALAGALVLSWITAIAIRRIPAVARIL
jgi:peptidoglycan/LPS O-acetylase OafA/YrhL